MFNHVIIILSFYHVTMLSSCHHISMSSTGKLWLAILSLHYNVIILRLCYHVIMLSSCCHIFMSSCHNLSYKNTLHYIEKQIGSLRLSLTTPRTKMSLFWTIRRLCKLLDGEDDGDGDGEDKKNLSASPKLIENYIPFISFRSPRLPLRQYTFAFFAFFETCTIVHICRKKLSSRIYFFSRPSVRKLRRIFRTPVALVHN